MRPDRARWLAGATAAAIGVTLAFRWVRTGHPPVFGGFEMDLAETLCVLLLGLWLARSLGPGYLLGPGLLSILTLAHALTLSSGATPLTISERSLWIDVHAPLGWLAWTFYFHALFLAFRADEARALRMLSLGFLAQTAMGFVGVYYASILFASPWSWDPVQTMALLSWVLFAMSFHFRLLHGVTLHRQRHFLVLLLAAYVCAAKLPMYLPPGLSFHVFEVGAMASE